MADNYDIKGMVEIIKAIRKNAEELKKISGGIPAVNRNADRILTNVKMLEIEISDSAGIMAE